MDVPFCFIKGKARLGKLVGKKTATCVAVTNVRGEDKSALDNLRKAYIKNFNENNDLKTKRG